MAGVGIRTASRLHQLVRQQFWCRHVCLTGQSGTSLTLSSRMLTSVSGYRAVGCSQTLSATSSAVHYGTLVPHRGLAKSANRGGGKDKKQKGKKGGKPKVELELWELNEVAEYDQMVGHMGIALDVLRQEYVEELNIRTTAGILDNLMVETSDGNFPLIQLGQVVQKNPQLVIINLASMAKYIPAVKTAIMHSGMSLNPQQDGSSLIVPIPKVTREHRERLSKVAKTKCQQAKEKIEAVQSKVLRKVRKTKDEHSQDLIHNVTEKIHLTTKEYKEQADALLAAKQQELLGV